MTGNEYNTGIHSTLDIFYDSIFLKHSPQDGAFEAPPSRLLAETEPHPDQPQRIKNIRHALETSLSDYISWSEVEPATREQIEQVHNETYIDQLKELSNNKTARLTPTTTVSKHTYEASRYAAGAAIQAAKRTLHSTNKVAYALIRPSGHHAQPAQADGFCYINNVAVAAEEALIDNQVERVAVIDWDVHPGNGTQEIFYNRDNVLFISLHNDFGSWGPSHPQTGGLEEKGIDEGEGYNVNVPLPPGTGNEGYRYAFGNIVEPIIESYNPDLLLISAGQDSGTIDPTARNLVTKSGFETLGEIIRDLSRNYVDGNLALVQEGGYQQTHLAFATLGIMEGVLNKDVKVADPWENLLQENKQLAEEWVDEAIEAYSDYWIF